jgi:DNA-binding CsgD family transcriptional regulator
VTTTGPFGGGQLEAEVFRNVVDAFGCAVFIATADMDLLYANPAGEQLLVNQVILKSDSGTLLFEDPRAKGFIARAIETGERGEIALGHAGLGVPQQSSPYYAIARVLPLQGPDNSTKPRDGALAAIFVTTTGTTMLPAIDAIAALFGLTAAEKRVALQIANGLSRAEIAATSKVSDSTVKSQLNAIFAKSHTSNQRELELLIRELTPPIINSDSNEFVHVPHTGEKKTV